MFQGSNRKKLIKALITLLALIFAIALLSHIHSSNSLTLTDYQAMQEK